MLNKLIRQPQGKHRMCLRVRLQVSHYGATCAAIHGRLLKRHDRLVRRQHPREHRLIQRLCPTHVDNGQIQSLCRLLRRMHQWAKSQYSHTLATANQRCLAIGQGLKVAPRIHTRSASPRVANCHGMITSIRRA